MSASALLAMPITTTLSVMRTFTSVPSRDLIASTAPSTASMVPRMRTDGGCWARAADPRAERIASVASARGNNEDGFGMVLFFLGLSGQRGEHRKAVAIPE